MRALALISLLGGMVALAWGQDGGQERSNLHAKVQVLKRNLGAVGESDRLEAIQGLGEVDDDEAITLLGAKLRTDTPAVRIAAAHAIARHRKPLAAQAIGAALDANAENQEVLHAFIEALAALDLCKGLPVLYSLLWLNKNALADPALDAIGRIACPEAAGALIDLLRKAEMEEKKPDVFEGDDGGAEVNRNKNKALAAVADKTRETLALVVGQRFANTREWSTWAGSEHASRLTSVFLCEAKGATYEAPSGKTKKCPYVDGQQIHKDILLKHVKE
jgi:hypothetical protein